MSKEINSLGNRQHYGPRVADTELGFTIGTSELEKTIEYVLEAGNLPYAVAENEGPTGITQEPLGAPLIPIGSTITEAKLVITEAFVGGTDLQPGLGGWAAGGEVIAFDFGFSGVAVGVQEASLAPFLTASEYLVIVSNSFQPTAGKAKLYVKYIVPQA